MRRILEILTPENVNVEYELAGLGSRFAALLIDHLIQAALIIAAVIAMVSGGMNFNGDGGGFIAALGIIAVFIIIFGYFIFFEMITNGQTPGKKALKLRVIRYNGEPLGFLDSLLRNVLRIADFLPALNLMGAVFIIFTNEYRRIGDYAANTVVVKVRNDQAPLSVQDLLKLQLNGADFDEKLVNEYPVTSIEYGILRDYLARRDGLGERKPVFEYHLSRYFMKKFGIEKPDVSSEKFLEKILKANS